MLHIAALSLTGPAADVAHAMASAAEIGFVSVEEVRTWLETTDLDTPHALLVRHGTVESYGMAHRLEEHGRGQDLEGILQAVDAAIIGAGLAHAPDPDDDFDDEEESIWDYTPPPSELY